MPSKLDHPDHSCWVNLTSLRLLDQAWYSWSDRQWEPTIKNIGYSNYRYYTILTVNTEETDQTVWMILLLTYGINMFSHDLAHLEAI